MQPIEDSPASDMSGSPANHLVEEMMACWESGFQAYASYLAALASARTPTAVMDANMDFMKANLSLAGEATGTLLRRHGVTVPVLNDA